MISLDFSGLVSNLVVVCSKLFGVTTFSFTSTNWPDLAVHGHQLRSLAPAAIEQRICSHNTRCRRCLWLSHNADKRIYRCPGVTARQRSYFGWCNGHLSAFSSFSSIILAGMSARLLPTVSAFTRDRSPF
jgi:hypothetical protein